MFAAQAQLTKQGINALNRGAPVQSKMSGFIDWGLPQDGIGQCLGLTTRAPEGKRGILCKACLWKKATTPISRASPSQQATKTVFALVPLNKCDKALFAEGELLAGGKYD